MFPQEAQLIEIFHQIKLMACCVTLMGLFHLPTQGLIS